MMISKSRVNNYLYDKQFKMSFDILNSFDFSSLDIAEYKKIFISGIEIKYDEECQDVIDNMLINVDFNSIFNFVINFNDNYKINELFIYKQYINSIYTDIVIGNPIKDYLLDLYPRFEQIMNILSTSFKVQPDVKFVDFLFYGQTIKMTFKNSTDEDIIKALLKLQLETPIQRFIYDTSLLLLTNADMVGAFSCYLLNELLSVMLLKTNFSIIEKG